jgi:putative transcriptional regulator
MFAPLPLYSKGEQENIDAATLKRIVKLLETLSAEILEGLEEIAKWKKGEIELKTTKLNLPTANDVIGIRERMGLSQQVFATFMGISIRTLRCWEQGVRERAKYK